MVSRTQARQGAFSADTPWAQSWAEAFSPILLVLDSIAADETICFVMVLQKWIQILYSEILFFSPRIFKVV